MNGVHLLLGFTIGLAELLFGWRIIRAFVRRVAREFRQ